MWLKESIGKLKSEPSQGGLGWYQDVLTLSAPYVPVQPEDRWWIQSVVEKVHESIASPHCLTVLLTGRTTAYLSIITALVQHKGLCFDHTLLKPLGGHRTFDFKRSAVRLLLSTYKNVTHLNVHMSLSLIIRCKLLSPLHQIYEDRDDHADKFRELLQQLKSIKGAVHLVEEQTESCLPRVQELELVGALLSRYGSGLLELHESVEYSCVLLDSASHKRLRTQFPSPSPEWHYRAHHMTLCLGPLVPSTGAVAGAAVTLQVVAVGRSDAALAVRVEGGGVRSLNAVPHITIAFAPTAHAKDSNDIKEWREATGLERMELQGTVQEMKRWALTAVKRQQRPPTGLNLGALVRSVHPSAEGPAIGELVKQLRDWLKEKNTSDEDEIKAHVKEMKVPVSSGLPARKKKGKAEGENDANEKPDESAAQDEATNAKPLQPPNESTPSAP